MGKTIPLDVNGIKELTNSFLIGSCVIYKEERTCKTMEDKGICISV